MKLLLEVEIGPDEDLFRRWYGLVEDMENNVIKPIDDIEPDIAWDNMMDLITEVKIVER